MSEYAYSVYLVEQGESGGKRQVTSPVAGRDLDFYDSGVWLVRETGRNFFPYEQIRTIREHPADYDTGGGSNTETAAESNHEDETGEE